MEYGMGWSMFAIGIAVLFSILALTIDFRFWILGLIWVFIVIPFTIFFLFVVYGMQPLTTYNTILHRIIFNPDSIVIEFLPEEEKSQTQTKTIELKSPLKIKSAADNLILFFNNPNKGILYLPLSSLPSNDKLNEITDFMTTFNKHS